MNSRNRSIILTHIRLDCPFCDFYCYFKYNLRMHLSAYHTDREADIYIKKVTRIPKCKGKICKM